MTYVSYDPDAGVVFLMLREPEGGERGGERIDEWRHRHYDHAGNVCAYEFLFVDRGISLDGIPAGDATLIREAIESMRRLSFGESPPAVSAAF